MSQCKLQNVSDPAVKMIGRVQRLIKIVAFFCLGSSFSFFFETVSPSCECNKIINHRIKGRIPVWKGPQA